MLIFVEIVAVLADYQHSCLDQSASESIGDCWINQMALRTNQYWIRVIFVLLTLIGATRDTYSQTTLPELRKLHALLVIDTRSGLGESVMIDGNRIEKVLKNGIPKDRLQLTILTDADVTSAKILQIYRNLKVDSSDALFFYYAGHGAIDPSKGHFLAFQQLETKPLLRSELKKAMQGKNAGLCVLITDCCSNRTKLPGKTRKVEVELGKARELSPVMRSLFFCHRGVVDITAAGDNTAAYGDDHLGGLFTRTLVSYLQKKPDQLYRNQDGHVMWQVFFSLIQRETERYFKVWAKEQRARGEPVAQNTQKPRAFSLGDARGGVDSVTLVNESNVPLIYKYHWEGETTWSTATIAPFASRAHDFQLSGESSSKPVVADRSKVLEVQFENGETGKLKVGKTYQWTSGTKRSLNDNNPTLLDKK